MGRNLIRVSAVMAVAALVVLGLPGVASAAIPTVPAGLTAVAGESESVVLSWTASSNTPTNYDVEYSPDGFVLTSKLFWHTASTATTITVTGLTNGLLYTFRVYGVNGDGTSAASATATAVPVSQHTPNDLALFDACPASLIASAGFDDTNSPDVACIKHYGITMGTTTTTFSPVDPVTRWQMALFLTRMVGPAGGVLPSGADQGFTDISGKDDEQQLAINQIRQMGITIGKTLTPLTYAPDQYVTREEMALFLQRLLKAVTAGPGGNVELVSANGTATEIKSVDTDHNFTDLNSVSLMEMQSAIINLWNLGVTEVATATLYEPSVNISRLNMAQMMARALDHTNARPAGLSIVASRYTSASTGLTISVTHRTAAPDFLPVVGSLVDTFRYLQTDTYGSSQFSSDGSCAQVVVTEVSSTLCYIDTSEKVTDNYGNIVPFISGVAAASIWEYYVWTASAGTTYDNDVHGTGTVMITVRG